jgi:hypothetical protein
MKCSAGDQYIPAKSDMRNRASLDSVTDGAFSAAGNLSGLLYLIGRAHVIVNVGSHDQMLT